MLVVVSVMAESQKCITFICLDRVTIDHYYTPSRQISPVIVERMGKQLSCIVAVPFSSDVFLPALESAVENFIEYDVRTEDEYLAIRWFEICSLCESAVSQYEPTVADMKLRYCNGIKSQMEKDFPEIYRDRMGLSLRIYIEGVKLDEDPSWILDVEHDLVKTELSSNRMLMADSITHIMCACNNYENGPYTCKTELRETNATYLAWEFGRHHCSMCD